MSPIPLYAFAAPIALSLLIGVMAMFSFVVAPSAFRLLPEDQAGKFVRGVFPLYYPIVTVLCALAGVGLVAGGPILSKIMFGMAALGLIAWRVLMPRINALRDRSLAGDASAKKWFGRLHGLSFAINGAQFAAAVASLVLYVA
ncbi:MAG: DUF4149 domain-containing protein [Rhodobacteraceae bacterium]|nr:MAG: DUF4149 domain-containing protein [Paracoccaceae bacterium]